MKNKILMQTERIISNTKVMIAILILEDIFIFSVANYILNFFIKIPDVIKDLDNPGKYIGIRYIFPSFNNLANHTSLFLAAYIILLIFCLIINGVSAYKIKTSMAEEYINVGNKGDERWTTNEEIKQQYKEIPDRDVTFEGSGGMIVSRMGDKLYIDQSAVNNLIIGITRSRKGETLVFPSIDVYSRAKEKASLVVIDPKLEGYKSSKKTLEKRGYEVRLLNLADPLHSMGFNPLAEIVQAYLNKDEAGAELLTQAFAFTIFNPSKPTCDGDTFWKDTPSSLLSALILAHVEDCVRADEMLNEKRRNIFNEKREAFDNLSDELKEKARTVYADEKSKNENVINNIKIKYLPPEEPFTKENKNIKKINMYSILNLFTELVRIVDEENADISALDTYFTKRPMLNRAKLKYAGIEMAGYRTKTSIFASMFAKLTIFTYENVAKMTAESSIKLEDVGFGEKPIAVFISIPDFDKSPHFLSTVFIRQLYFVLAKKATFTKSQKCTRHVKFIADEFGNIPAIENMENIITVCLGRNISFDMYIQSISQLTALYADHAKTIRTNCGNQIYLLADDNETAEDFSKLIGSETVIDVQRSGERLSLKKHYMEQTIEKPLLNPNQLMGLREGECVVKRVMKRTDLQGNRIKPTPIFNSEESGKRFLARYEYLTDTFPNPTEIDLEDINTEDRSYINLTERVWDYKQTFTYFKHQELADNKNVKRVRELNNFVQIKEIIKNSIGNEIDGNMTTTELTSFVSVIPASWMKEDEREALLSLIKLGEG